MGYFILGMITVQFIFPLLDGVLSVILTALEAAKGYFGAKVAERNNQIRNITIQPEETHQRAIGFAYEKQGDEDEEVL